MDMNRKRVLIVDDDEQSRMVFDGYLRSLGFETAFASDGRDALFLLVGDSRFDLVIADLIMPNMTGFDLSRELKAYSRTRAIPVIATSAVHDWHRTIDRRDLFVDGFVGKPVECEALARELDRVLKGTSPALDTGGG